MCEHLQKAEDYLLSQGFIITWRGQPWSDNCREWVYFDSILATEELKTKLPPDACIETHEYYDMKAGPEPGN